MLGLRDGKITLRICSAVSREYRRVTDGQTDGQTDRHTSCHDIVRAMHTRRAVITSHNSYTSICLHYIRATVNHLLTIVSHENRYIATKYTLFFRLILTSALARTSGACNERDAGHSLRQSCTAD